MQNGHCFAIFHPQVRVGQRAHLLAGILRDRERHSIVVLLLACPSAFIRPRKLLYVLHLGPVVGRQQKGPLGVRFPAQGSQLPFATMVLNTELRPKSLCWAPTILNGFPVFIPTSPPSLPSFHFTIQTRASHSQPDFVLFNGGSSGNFSSLLPTPPSFNIPSGIDLPTFRQKLLSFSP